MPNTKIIQYVSGEIAEIEAYYKNWIFGTSPLDQDRLAWEYHRYNRQFAFVYGPEEIINDPQQRAQALGMPFVPNDPRYWLAEGITDEE